MRSCHAGSKIDFIDAVPGPIVRASTGPRHSRALASRNVAAASELAPHAFNARSPSCAVRVHAACSNAIAREKIAAFERRRLIRRTSSGDTIVVRR